MGWQEEFGDIKNQLEAIEALVKSLDLTWDFLLSIVDELLKVITGIIPGEVPVCDLNSLANCFSVGSVVPKVDCIACVKCVSCIKCVKCAGCAGCFECGQVVQFMGQLGLVQQQNRPPVLFIEGRAT